MIAAIGRNRELGKGNDLLWKIPDDLKRFKEKTRGHPIIMGRKTFDSIGKPLPDRTNIVITRDPAWHYLGTMRAGSLEEGIEHAKKAPGAEEIFIGGGGQIYAEALPLVDKLYLTLIEDDKDGDSYFPEYEHLFTREVAREEHEWNGLQYAWVDLER
jgi:dihydrofolate reductase